MKKILAIVVAVSLLASSAMLETVPLQISYQGRLTDPAGTPLNGTFDMIFRIYDGPDAGATLLWYQPGANVDVSNGIMFPQILNPGILNPGILNSGIINPGVLSRFLEVEVQGEVISPRVELVSSPFSIGAYSLAGDIFTSPGHVYLIPNGPAVSDCTYVPLEMAVDSNVTRIRLKPFNPASDCTYVPLQLSTNATESKISLKPPDPGMGGTIELTTDDATGASLGLSIIDPNSNPVPTLQLNGGTATSGASMVMVDPSNPNLPAIQINGGTATSGASLEIFNSESNPGPISVPAVQITGGTAIIDPNLKLMDTKTGPGGGLKTSNAELTVNGDMGSSFMLHHMEAVGIDPCVRLFSEGAAAGISIYSDPIPHLKRTSDSAVINLRTDTINAKIEMFGAAPGTEASIVLVSDNSGGMVGINTDAPREALEVVGNICATGTIGACSDERYKKNIETITNALALIEKMRGVNFKWRAYEFPDKKFSELEQVGFIAQELKEVLPELVSEGSDGFYSVDYSRLTPVLVEAVKEQQKEITSLKSEMQELKRLVKALATASSDKKVEVAVSK